MTKEKIIDLLKRTFEIWEKKQWLKEIDRAIDRYGKAKRKADCEYYVVQCLIVEYNEKYNENLWRKSNEQ